MNILFYIDRYPGVGGIENVSTTIINELRKKHNVYVISHFAQQGCEIPCEIKVFFMPNPTTYLAQENEDFYLALLKQLSIDKVIYQDSYGPTESIVCKSSEILNIPVYVFEHNSPLFIYNKRNLDPIYTLKGFGRRVCHPYLLYKEKKRKRYLLKYAAKYVLLSKNYIPEFCNLVGASINDNRITYINNPIRSIVFQPIPKENIVLCVSRLAKEKRVDAMIRLWSMIESKLPDWQFLIVGDGPERSKLEALVNDNKIPRIAFLGFTNPTEYYKKAKIFWMTSKYEGWPMTLIETMQYGCIPIAYSSFSSLLDIIDDNINGFVIKNNDSTSFLEKTLELATDDNKMDCFRNSAVKKVENFELEKVLVSWATLLNIELSD